MGKEVGGGAVDARASDQGDKVGDGAMANNRTCGFAMKILGSI